jgi:hypothetical protein
VEAAAETPLNNLIPIANPRELAQLELEFDSTIPLDKVRTTEIGIYRLIVHDMTCF